MYFEDCEKTNLIEAEDSYRRREGSNLGWANRL